MVQRVEQAITPREQVLGRRVRSFTPRRIRREGLGSFMVQVGSGLEQIGGITGAAGLALEGLGLVVAGKKSFEIKRAEKDLRNNPASTDLPRVIGAADYVLEDHELIPEVQHWQERQHQLLQDRVSELGKTKKREKIHAMLYPLAMGLARGAVMTGAGLLKTGLGVAAFTHPELFIPAFLAAGPVGIGLLVATVGASAVIGLLGVGYVNNLIKRYENEHRSVDITAGKAIAEIRRKGTFEVAGEGLMARLESMGGVPAAAAKMFQRLLLRGVRGSVDRSTPGQ